MTYRNYKSLIAITIIKTTVLSVELTFNRIILIINTFNVHNYERFIFIVQEFFFSPILSINSKLLNVITTIQYLF